MYLNQNAHFSGNAFPPRDGYEKNAPKLIWYLLTTASLNLDIKSALKKKRFL